MNMYTDTITDMIPRNNELEYIKDYKEIYNEDFKIIDVKELEIWSDKIGNEYATVSFLISKEK